MLSSGNRPDAVVAILVAAVTGCGDEARVKYSFFEEPGFAVDLLRLEFSDPHGSTRLDGSGFEGGSTRRDTKDFGTATVGTLVTSFSLVQGAETVASGELEVPLRPDWRWTVVLQRADADPTATCFGCFGSRAFALPPSLRRVVADSLWVVWDGNSISNPVVF